MKSEISDKVPEEIISAATLVFENYGFTRVSMQDISKASGKGRTTLYYYFKNKGEVFDGVIDKLFKVIFCSCKAELDSKGSLATNIENFHKRKLQEIKKMTKKYNLVLVDLKQDPSLMLTKLRVQMGDETELIHQVIKWSIANKEIAYLKEEDSRFLAETLVIAFKSFEQEIILFDRFPNYEAKLAWISQIFCKGLK
jgi:AcrR family transcriptional regulator